MKRKPPIPDAIVVARLRARQSHPYFTALLSSLTPIEVRGLGTMAVDKYARLYYDPAYLAATPDEEMETTILHEIGHLFLRHHARLLEALEDRRLAHCAEWAKECAVNTTLAQSGCRIPKSWVFPERLKLPPGLSTEEYYELLQKQVEQGGQGDGTGSDRGDDQSARGDPDSESRATADRSPDDSASDGSASGDGGPGDTEGTDGSGSQSCNGGQPGDDLADGQEDPVDRSDCRDGNEGSGTGNTGGTLAGQGRKRVDRSQGQGGSAHDGQRRPWEEGPLDNSNGSHESDEQMDTKPTGNVGTSQEPPSGLDSGDLDILIEYTARQIEEWQGSHGRGSVPWGFAREARQILHPTVDPVARIESLLRHSMDATYGYGLFTYRRPSRRQPPGGAIQPVHRKPVPRLLVIADTSGSMGERDLGLCLGVVDRVIRKLPDPRGVEVWAGDTSVAAVSRVFRPEQVELAGGGGTDMAALILQAMEKPRPPDVIMVATDGETGWPKLPVAAKVIACLTRKPHCCSPPPEWIEMVELRPEEE